MYKCLSVELAAAGDFGVWLERLSNVKVMHAKTTHCHASEWQAVGHGVKNAFLPFHLEYHG